tara:strand:+ start:1410 stop:1895 length:486 start_codon:yes stop_codon:yes gene_type:complete
VIVLGVDPGLRKLGVAIYEDGELVHADTVRTAMHVGTGPACWLSAAKAVRLFCRGFQVDVLAIEVMQVDSRTKGAIIGDILELSGVVGAVAATVAAPVLASYTPAEWKGQRPKDVEHRYLKRVLSPVELNAVGILGHDAWDAIGIGAHYLRSTCHIPRWIR